MANWKIAGREVNPIGIGIRGMGGDRLEDGNPYADYRHDDRKIAAIRGLDRTKLFIATKVWHSHSLRHVVPRAVEESLRKLKIDALDLLYVHAPWNAILVAEYISGLNDALDAGLTRAIAVSNFSSEELEQAISLSRHPIVADQVHYNMLHRGAVDREDTRPVRAGGARRGGRGRVYTGATRARLANRTTERRDDSEGIVDRTHRQALRRDPRSDRPRGPLAPGRARRRRALDPNTARGSAR